MHLVAVRQTSHTAHYAEHVVRRCVDTYLSGVGALNGSVGENKLEGSVVDSGHVAGARRLVFLRAESE